ncbi:hypothetical protein CPAR01_14533 [Colletotrichum paranaense]|uniref:Monooxygenase n=1 Tax=Colletotrichum paranaense TaxID=1914294 RepID=A0ABQ9S3S4_9PEZI|nr:uncharacterized protein CPAR01_14533 [Colletotrichum paranaense]KAK1522990.1 hypothetical protein CPAR01_14533 [Colletotrichum paranaense]
MHLAKDSVIKIGPHHVETTSGVTYPADTIIYATGSEVALSHGDQGRERVPNFFILYGPNAATGQHSVIFHSECQINYTCRLLRQVLTGNDPAASIMVKPEAQRRDLAWVHDKLRYPVFNSGCQSWWMDPKTKKNTFIYPDPMFLY